MHVYALVLGLGAPAVTVAAASDTDGDRAKSATPALVSSPLVDTETGNANPWATPLQLQTLPVVGSPSSAFGLRRDPIRRRRRRQHNGLDFGAARRTPVFAAATGIVVRAGRKGGYGKLVIIDHGGGWTTRYAHLRRIDVRRGDRVSPGDRVGRVGTTGRSTGPHLHFEVRKDDEAVDPIGLFPVEISSLIEQSLKGNRDERAWARAELLTLARGRDDRM